MKPITKRILTGGITAIIVFSALLALQMRPQPLVPMGAAVTVDDVIYYDSEGQRIPVGMNDSRLLAVANLLAEQNCRRMLLSAAAPSDADCTWEISLRTENAGDEEISWRICLGAKNIAYQGNRCYTLPGGAELSAALDELLL